MRFTRHLHSTLDLYLASMDDLEAYAESESSDDIQRRATRLDPLSPEERSQRMRQVRSKDTKPEMLVRRLVHGMGFRYRLHRADLPGRPDLVFRSRKKVIFVHGCFWHGHVPCDIYRVPKSRSEYWATKLAANRDRDRRTREELRTAGWSVHVVWECQLRSVEALRRQLLAFLRDDG